MGTGLEFQLFQKLGQHQFGVAHHRVVGLHVVIDVVFIVGGVDDDFAGRHLDAKVGLAETDPDAEYQVGPGQVAVYPQGGAGTAAAHEEGMVLRERALAAQGCHHRGLQELGHFYQFAGSLGIHDSLSGVDDRVLGGQQCPGGPADRFGVAGAADGLRWFVVEVQLAQLFRPNVLGDLQKHWTGPAASQFLKSPAHHLGNCAGGGDLSRPLGDGFIASGGVEGGGNAQAFPGGGGGEQQHGHRVGVGLSNTAKSVFRSGAALH